MAAASVYESKWSTEEVLKVKPYVTCLLVCCIFRSYFHSFG